MAKEINNIIEITDTHVKFLQGKTVKGERTLNLCEVRRLGQVHDDEIARAVKEVLRFKNVPAPELLLVIPRHLAILKHMRLPSHNEDEIRKMVEMHLVQQIPYALNEVVFDYFLLDKDPAGYSRILTIIVHKEVSERYIKIFQNAGVSINRLTLSSLGILGWLAFEEKKKILDSAQSLMILDVDAARSEICFCNNGKLTFTRSISYGAQDLTHSQVANIVQQIELSLRTYRKENMGPEVHRIIIISSLSEAVPLKEELEGAFKISVDILTSMEQVPHPKNLNLQPVNEERLSLTAALGLLLTETRRIINLTPQEVHKNTETKLKKKQLVVTGILLCLTALLASGVFGYQLYQKNDLLGKLQTKSRQLDGDFKGAQGTIKNLDFLSRSMQKKLLVADVIHALSVLTPPEISFRSIALTRGGQLIIEGYGQTNASVQNFRTQLVQSPLFKESVLQSSSERKIYNMDIIEFKITSKLTGKE